jgi:hypothetical protein
VPCDALHGPWRDRTCDPPSKTSADEPIVEGATANLVRQIPFSRAMELLTGRLMVVDCQHEPAEPIDALVESVDFVTKGEQVVKTALTR